MGILILLIFSLNFIICSENHFETKIKTENHYKTSVNIQNSIKTKSETKFHTSLMSLPKINLKNIKFPIGATVYFEGWVKFFHYNNGSHYNHPKAFFQNSDYYGQRIIKPDKNNADKLGLLRIPSQAHYYLVAYGSSIAFYTNRDRILSKLVDNLKIDFIKPIPEDQPSTGAIKDLGDFDEGKCIEISVSVPRSYKEEFKFDYIGRDQVWVVCSDNGSQRDKLFTVLLKLRIRRQRKFGKIATQQSIKKKRRLSVNNLFRNPIKRDLKVGVLDGHWILLQDWTTCTLSCGGGLSYQQFMCVPPKNGGKPCKGKAIRTKPCNTHKCPDVNVHLKHLLNQKKMKTIVKILPFSQRPQRYSKCLIKETDAYLMKKDSNGRLVAKQPVRILMNNKTFSIFEDDNYHSKLYTYQLDNSQLFISTNMKCCFNLKDNYHQYDFCGFESECGARNEWALGWSNDWDLFKIQCKVGIKLLDATDLRILNDEYKNKIGQVNEDLVAEKEKVVQRKIKEKDLEIMSSKIANSQNMGFQVLSKELNIEDLITKEEKDREELERKNLLDKIKREKKKKECLEKKIKYKRLEGEREIKKSAFSSEISKIKKDMALNIEIKRAELKKKIILLRRRASRRRASLEQQLLKVKSKMSQELMSANKKGLIKNCKKGNKNQRERVAYCNANFIADFIKNTECKEKDGFCYMCCENEFGDMFIKLRDKCYNMCDGKQSNSNKKSKKSSKGKWIWRPKQVKIENKFVN